MSKYSHFEMCEKIFGQKYKWNEQKHDYEPYSRTDMWNKMIEQQDKIADLEAKLAESEEKKAYSRGHSQRDIANEIKLNALREDVANKEKRIVELKQQLAEKEKFSPKSSVKEIVKSQDIKCFFRDKTLAQIQKCGDVYSPEYGYFNFEDDYDELLNNKKDDRFDIVAIEVIKTTKSSD